MATQLELYQKLVLQRALPLPEKIVEAFYQYPRHLFVPEYSLEEAYSDHPLALYEKAPYSSTISQPSFVLKILDLLQLTEGQKVFELGAGSGWNTALMSAIVGATGKVVSAEIIPELAERSREILQAFSIKNVLILSGDGFEGYSAEAPYDRAIFTAGSSEFPQKLFEQLKEGGLLIFVRKHTWGYDTLEVIRKNNGAQEILSTLPCAFVSVIRHKGSRLDSDGTL